MLFILNIYYICNHLNGLYYVYMLTMIFDYVLFNQESLFRFRTIGNVESIIENKDYYNIM